MQSNCFYCVSFICFYRFHLSFMNCLLWTMLNSEVFLGNVIWPIVFLKNSLSFSVVRFELSPMDYTEFWIVLPAVIWPIVFLDNPCPGWPWSTKLKQKRKFWSKLPDLLKLFKFGKNLCFFLSFQIFRWLRLLTTKMKSRQFTVVELVPPL